MESNRSVSDYSSSDPNAFDARLESFQGPLEVMLSLARKEKLDLFELDLSIVADQYIAWILRQDSLDAASEHMVEFCRLLEYKSKKLLPKPDEQAEEEIEEIESDYRQKLQLLALYQNLAAGLKERGQVRSRQLSRPEDLFIQEMKKTVLLEQSAQSVTRLSKAWKELAGKWKQSEIKAQPFREIDILEWQEKVLGYFQKDPSLTLENLMQHASDIRQAIGIFLALLELIHKGMIVMEKDRLIIHAKSLT